jgi:peptide/nickel transport system substrate-binding protein
MRIKVLTLLAVAAMVAGACSNTPGATTGASAAPPSTGTSAAPSTGTSAAPSGGTTGGTGTLRVARLADAYNFFHPVEDQTGNQFQWWNCLFNTLVTVDADSKTIMPGLADKWDASADATTYTFHLHPGVKWHDGVDFTANDVIYSASFFAQNPASYKGFQPVWGQVKGAADAKGTTNTPAGITAPDPNTVVITLAAPNSEFLVQMTDMANAIIPQHILKDVTAADVEKVPFTLGTPGTTVGTGPYKLTAFTPDQSVEFTANPDYFKGAPKIPKIVFKIFKDSSLAIAQLQSGDLDLAFRAPPNEFDGLSKNPNLTVVGSPNPGIFRIVFDTTAAPWDKKEVRQAFYYAINRQAICDQVFKGRCHVLINHPGFKVYDDENKYDYSVDKAKAQLQAGGYAGQHFRLIYDQTFPNSGAIMPLIQGDLQKAGITVDLMPLDTATFGTTSNKRGAWDGFIAIGGSEALSPQKTKQYYKAAPDGAKFQSGYTNPQIFDLWAKGLSTTDPAAQDAAYHQLALILNTDVPMINLYADDLIQAYTKKLGGGFKVHLNERETFMNVETWTLGS